MHAILLKKSQKIGGITDEGEQLAVEIDESYFSNPNIIEKNMSWKMGFWSYYTRN